MCSAHQGNPGVCSSLTWPALECEPGNPGLQTLGCLHCQSLRTGEEEEEGSLQARGMNVKTITEESRFVAHEQMVPVLSS